MKHILPRLIFIFFLQVFLFYRAGAQTDQTVNNGNPTTPVNFPAGGCTYQWTNSNPSIGLPASGTGDIPSFKAINNGSSPVSATITATSASAGIAYIPCSSSNNVYVIDLATNKLIKIIPVGFSPISAAISPDGKRVYIANQGSASVSVIDAVTNSVVATIPFSTPGSEPSGIAISPDGNKVYVTDYRIALVAIINSSTNTIVGNIPVGNNPFDITITPDGSKLYVLNLIDSDIMEISTTTNQVLSTFTDGGAPSSLCLSPDGSTLYVPNYNSNNVSVINTVNNSLVTTINAGQSPVTATMSPDGSRLYIANINDNTVSVINASNNKLITNVGVGALPFGVSLNPDGSKLYVTSSNAQNTFIINTNNNSVIGTINTGLSPESINHFISAGPGCSTTPVSFKIIVNNSTQSIISATTPTGTIQACQGTVSSSPNIEQFVVSGTSLTNGVTVTAPNGFEVSLSKGSGYSNSFTIAQSGGNIAGTVVYVRSAASASGNISGSVVLSSSGASDQHVTVKAKINALPTVNQIPNQTIVNGSPTTAVSFAGTANTYTWTNNTAAIGLAASGTGDIPSFTAINNGNSPVTATITVTPQNSGFAYITNSASNSSQFASTVSVINISTNKVIANIPVGKQPQGVSVSPDGTLVYVANYLSNSISVISTATNSVIATIPVGRAPFAIAFNSDGSRAYVTNSDVSNSVSVINTATNTVVATIPVGSSPYGIAVSPDDSRVYVANVLSNSISVIDAATNTVISTIATSEPRGISITPDGSEIFVTNLNTNTVSVINTSNNTVAATIPVGNGPFAVSMSPDGSRLYVANQVSNNVSVLNTSTNSVIATIPVGNGPFGLSATADGNEVFVANYLDGNVSVINTSNNAIIATIPVGSVPFAFGNFISKGSGCTGSPITFTITVNPASVTPVVTTGTITGTISACQGLASASPDIGQFTVSGSNLTSNVTLNSPANFEISLSPDAGYGASLTLTPTGGSLSSTIIYVRSAVSAPPGSISGSISIISGTINQVVPVTGSVYALPAVNAAGNQTVTAGAQTTAINFTGTGSTYNWANTDPSIGLPANGTGNIPSFTAINAGSSPVTATITVMPISVSGCTGTPVTFNITVNPQALPSITASGTPSQLTTTYGTPSSSASFAVSGTNLKEGVLVSPPPGFEVSSDGHTFGSSVTVGAAGNVNSLMIYIRLTATTPAGIYTGSIVLSTSGAAPIQVIMPDCTVNPAPLLITADDKTKISGAPNPVLTVSYSGFVNHETPADLTSKPAVSTTATTASPPGDYTIVVNNAADSNYAISYNDGILTVTTPPVSIVIPNAFTPNGDGINDFWDIGALAGYPQCLVSVYTRYGSLVFQSKGYAKPWDGTSNKSPVPAGTYYYVIDLQNGQHPLSGYVAVLR